MDIRKEKNSSSSLSKRQSCFLKVNQFISFPLILLIKFYRKFISPAIPPTCRFYPTCSEYSLEALKKYGFFKGLFLSVLRILKCNPLHPGGHDPLP